MYHSFNANIIDVEKQLLNKKCSWAANQNIRMISEGSCDTEDWSNDAENSDLITEMNYILRYSSRKELF